MKTFIATLCENANTPILDWILKYIGKMKVDNLNGETILNLVDKRVEKYVEGNVGWRKIKRLKKIGVLKMPKSLFGLCLNIVNTIESLGSMIW